MRLSYHGFFLLILLGCFSLGAQTPDDASMSSRIEKGMVETIRNNFSGAEEIFWGLIRDYPRRPAGYFYLGATYQARMLDEENYDSLQAFTELMDTTIKLAKECLKKNENDVWALFFEGSAYVYKSYMDSKLGKMWRSYRNAARGVNRLEKVLKKDSSFYDAYLGIGSFKYWKSSKTRSLKWLPFFSDERDRAIPLILKAIDKGKFTQRVGRDQLAWIYMDYGKPNLALQLALQNYHEFPESRFFRWTLVAAYYHHGELSRAYDLYAELLEEVRQLPTNNHYNEIVCLLRMAEIKYQLKDYFAVEKLTSELLSLPLSEEVRKRTRKKRERALELKQKSVVELAKRNGTHSQVSGGMGE
ncbi:MAG: hypothetical protein D6748_14515 [Calditrichaeota bacterium]|nr:MAG: hypothetical protein D6748_14515 [Calditrichota bacterium]